MKHTKLLNRYATARGLKSKVLKRRWATLPAKTRAKLASEINRMLEKRNDVRAE